MNLEKLFEMGSGGFKIVVKTTENEQGKFDAKITAEKGGEVVASDLVFNVVDSEKNQRKSLMARLEEENTIGLLVEFANKRLTSEAEEKAAPSLEQPPEQPEQASVENGQPGDQLELLS